MLSKLLCTFGLHRWVTTQWYEANDFEDYPEHQHCEGVECPLERRWVRNEGWKYRERVLS